MNRKDRIDPTELVAQKRASTVPKSHYKNTFRGQQQRPRSTKRPPPSPRDSNPPPMSFVTNQRTDFVEKDINARRQLVKMEENYAPSNEALEGTTNYMRDYPGHFVLPEIHKVPEEVARGGMKKSSAKMDSKTTTKEHYRRWVPEPSLTFGELPTFTDSILYPDQNRFLETTTGRTFKGEPGKRSDPAQHSGGNIKLEGAHEHDTTHKMTFKRQEGARPAQKIVHQPEVKVNQRSKFVGTTQSMSDFPNFGAQGQPRPPKPVEPAPATIELKFDDRTSFDTEQRKEYQGIDCRAHPVAKSYKTDDDKYKPPDEKFETHTSQKLDYRPIELKDVYSAPVKAAETKRISSSAKFDDRTMNKAFFKKWAVEPRMRHGDFHEAHSYVPPSDKFQGSTTTGETFVPKQVEIPNNYKPNQKALARDGDHDFNTMYKMTFNKPNPIKNLNKQQAAQLLKELRQRKIVAHGAHQKGKQQVVAAK